jgi:RNA polymerase sigma-70 factor (ECF subfamily)
VEKKMEQNDEQFIEKLYDEMFESLLRYAKKILHDDCLAEEAVQETFRIACQKSRDLLASPNPEGWLYLTLQNAIRTMKRNQDKLARMIVYVSAVEDLERFSGEEVKNENPDILYEDLVGQKEYELLKKFAIEKRTISEIADELGISLNACKQRIFRAKKYLREQIEKHNS